MITNILFDDFFVASLVFSSSYEHSSEKRDFFVYFYSVLTSRATLKINNSRRGYWVSGLIFVS